MIRVVRPAPMEEVLITVADIALFLEDNAPDVMGGKKGYSVNINFRKDGGILFSSIEAYGNGKHISRTKQVPVESLRRDRRNRNTIIGAVAAGVLAFVLMMLIK